MRQSICLRLMTEECFMPESMRCPQGHEWKPNSPRRGDTVSLQLPCPVCGTLVPTKPGYLKEALQNTDTLCNSPVRGTGISDRPTVSNGGSELAPVGPMDRTFESLELEGPQIKGYSILRELGRGGMG